MAAQEQEPTLQQQEIARFLVYNTTSAAEKQPHSFFESVVFVDVGPEQISYAIHKGILCSRSDYFRAALTGNFSEAAEQVVTLDDEDPDTFRTFNAWLYTNVLVEDPDPDKTHWSLLFSIYFFAEKRIIPLLQNAAIDEIIRANKNAYVPAEAMRHTWTRTAETSPLRKLLVDLRLIEPDNYFVSEYQSNIDQYGVEFVAAVAIRLKELLTLELNSTDNKPGSQVKISQWLYVISNPWEIRCQRYHTHEPLDVLCGNSM